MLYRILLTPILQLSVHSFVVFHKSTIRKSKDDSGSGAKKSAERVAKKAKKTRLKDPPNQPPNVPKKGDEVAQSSSEDGIVQDGKR